MDTSSRLAMSIHSASDMFQYLSPSAQKYSRPIQTVCSGSLTMYGDQLLKIWMRPRRTCASCT